MREGLRVAVVPPPLKEDRWHTVEAADEGTSAGQLVALSGVHDIAAAQELVGKRLLARVADLPADVALHDVDALIGRAVVDVEGGRAGTIEEIYVGPANDVWSIELLDAARGVVETYLIPVIPEVVDDVPQEGAILIRIPNGLEPDEVRRADAASPDETGRA